LSICEYYSAKLSREVIVPARGYWVGLWMDWARDVSAYVELPANPDSPESWLADFWVEFRGQEFLIDVQSGESPPGTKATPDPWSLQSDGFESGEDGKSRITPRWEWARRSLLISLEQAHPYAVSARRQGGLTATCRKILEGWPEEGIDLASLCSRPGANTYLTQCAAFHLVRTGKLQIDWGERLSLATVLRRTGHASQG
jgi:hypothetical protein